MRRTRDRRKIPTPPHLGAWATEVGSTIDDLAAPSSYIYIYIIYITESKFIIYPSKDRFASQTWYFQKVKPSKVVVHGVLEGNGRLVVVVAWPRRWQRNHPRNQRSTIPTPPPSRQHPILQVVQSCNQKVVIVPRSLSRTRCEWPSTSGIKNGWWNVTTTTLIVVVVGMMWRIRTRHYEPSCGPSFVTL